jgi:hypothetical protein
MTTTRRCLRVAALRPGSVDIYVDNVGGAVQSCADLTRRSS